MPFDASGGNARSVIALDLSGTCGVAWGPLSDPLPRFTTWKLLRDQGEGGRYASFENELEAAMDDIQPSNMVIEATLTFQALARYSNYQVGCQQITLRGIARMVAWRAEGCSVSEVDARTVRAEVLGLSFGTDRETAKRAAILYCWKHKLKVPDDNAADACLIWLWHRMRVLRIPPVAGPLFREVA